MTLLSKILANNNIPFYSNSVTWPAEYLGALQRIRRKGEDVGRQEFLQHVKWKLDKAPNDLIPEDDGYIAYRKYEKIYYFIHSGVEYVFAEPDQVKAIQDLIDREDLDPESDEYNYDFQVKSEKETGNRQFILNRRKLLQQTESLDLLKKAANEDTDPECVRIARKRLVQ